MMDVFNESKIIINAIYTILEYCMYEFTKCLKNWLQTNL